MKANTKKNSTTKKLVPAAGSLLISAAMLGTSTYAWFTMSREVEIKNIQMTATTPEDVQLSLGQIGTDSSTAVTNAKGANAYSLKASTGVLVKGGATADNGQVHAPSDNAWDWSNVADISAYYSIGKLIPASSTNGEAIIFTPDADGVGKSISSGAQFIKADADTANAPNGAADSGSTVGYKATLHAYTDVSSKTWTSSGSTAYNATYDDGYYVDIPVWLRTSSTEGVDLSVKAYVIPKTKDQTANSDGEALYRAVRVAILNGSNTGGAANTSGTGLIPVADGWNISSASGTDGNLKPSPFSGESILNWYNQSGTVSTGTTSENVAAAASGKASSRFDESIYSKASVYDKASPFIHLAAGTGQKYGKASQVIIRVWLEGEDPDCWNETAGQDWSINLKFFKTSESSSDVDIESTTNN